MAKRRADKELTDSNWNEEDPEEEPGVFQKASKDELAKREIRRAKRSLPRTGEPSGASPFAGFSFTGRTNGTSTPPSSGPSEQPQSNGQSDDTGYSDEHLRKVAQLNKEIITCITKFIERSGHYVNLTPSFEDYIMHFEKLTREEDERQKKNNNEGGRKPNPFAEFSFGKPGVFKVPEQIQGKSAVTETPSERPRATFSFGTLTAASSTAQKPSTFGGASTAASKLPGSPSVLAPATPASTFVFSAPPAAAKLPSFASIPTVAASASTFVFGSASSTRKDPESSAGSPKFISGLPPAPNSDASTFSFGGPTTSTPNVGFKFGVSAVTSSTSAFPVPSQGGDDEDEDAPPKVDVAPVEEDGSLYTKKVKLFYKKDSGNEDKGGAYADKGMGYLHVKKIEGGGHQLLVRAQTTLGNVLLNIRLRKDMPVTRLGKNHVGIICIPNPPLNPTHKENSATTFLIRVKTAEDADELRDQLEEFKST